LTPLPQEDEDWGLEEEVGDWDLEEDDPKADSNGRRKRLPWDGFIRLTFASDHTLTLGEMIMELIGSHERNIPDWTPERWAEYFYRLGNIPLWAIWTDTDRYWMVIYAIEFLRAYASKEECSEALRKYLRIGNKFDPSQYNEAQMGRSWGCVEKDGDVEGNFGLAHPDLEEDGKTIRDWALELTRKNIETNKPRMIAADPVTNERWERLHNDPWRQMWDIAENIARKKSRKDWDGRLDPVLDKMVRFCFHWIRDIGEVPRPYPASIRDLYFPIPRVLDQSEDGVERRNYITARVRDFWTRSVSKARKRIRP
jgi:hypothetical protein